MLHCKIPKRKKPNGLQIINNQKRKYYKKQVTTMADRMAVAIMVAVVGYLVTGIANDSTVAVAPLFWAMLGLGMAINRRK